MASKSTALVPSSTYSSCSYNENGRRSIFNDSEADWVRPDGRAFHQSRPAFFKTGAVNVAAGSAYAEFGNTKVIVSVFGPRESKKAMMYSSVGLLNCNVSYATFSSQVRCQESEHNEFSSTLHKALEGAIMVQTFPKSTVDVFALVLESGGSDLPVIISCASLAVADAGIMMNDLVVGISMSYIGANLIIDPLLEEECCQDGSLLIAFMPSCYEIIQLTVTGEEWSNDNINKSNGVRYSGSIHVFSCGTIIYFHVVKGILLCQDACSKLATVMRACLGEANCLTRRVVPQNGTSELGPV